MANGTTRWGSILVALVVGFALGWLVAGKKGGGRAAETPGKKHIVVIGPAADHLSEPRVYISKADPKEMIWLSNERQSLKIVFPKKQAKLPPQAQGKKPFQQMHEDGDDWVFDRGCGGGQCLSGPINPDLDPGAWGDLEYKYDQILAGDRKDGWIVIQR